MSSKKKNGKNGKKAVTLQEVMEMVEYKLDDEVYSTLDSLFPEIVEAEKAYQEAGVLIDKGLALDAEIKALQSERKDMLVELKQKEAEVKSLAKRVYNAKQEIAKKHFADPKIKNRRYVAKQIGISAEFEQALAEMVSQEIHNVHGQLLEECEQVEAYRASLSNKINEMAEKIKKMFAEKDALFVDADAIRASAGLKPYEKKTDKDEVPA